MANRQPFPRHVIREIARRAVNAIGEKACENCGAVGVPLELHHLDQDAMKTPEAKRRKLTAANGAFWCGPCHKPESARQRVVLAKVERVEAAYWLPRQRGKIPTRKFAGPAPKNRSMIKRANGERRLYVNTEE